MGADTWVCTYDEPVYFTYVNLSLRCMFDSKNIRIGRTGMSDLPEITRALYAVSLRHSNTSTPYMSYQETGTPCRSVGLSISK